MELLGGLDDAEGDGVGYRCQLQVEDMASHFGKLGAGGGQIVFPLL